MMLTAMFRTLMENVFMSRAPGSIACSGAELDINLNVSCDLFLFQAG